MDIAYVVKGAKKRRNQARTRSEFYAGYYSVLLESAWEEAAGDKANTKLQSQDITAFDETLFEFS
jgi:hypothetical protein